jgi:hypothetical protein
VLVVDTLTAVIGEGMILREVAKLREEARMWSRRRARGAPEPPGSLVYHGGRSKLSQARRPHLRSAALAGSIVHSSPS